MGDDRGQPAPCPHRDAATQHWVGSGHCPFGCLFCFLRLISLGVTELTVQTLKPVPGLSPSSVISHQLYDDGQITPSISACNSHEPKFHGRWDQAPFLICLNRAGLHAPTHSGSLRALSHILLLPSPLTFCFCCILGLSSLVGSIFQPCS